MSAAAIDRTFVQRIGCHIVIRTALMLDARSVKAVRALVGGWNQWVAAGNKIVTGDRPTP